MTQDPTAQPPDQRPDGSEQPPVAPPPPGSTPPGGSSGPPAGYGQPGPYGPPYGAPPGGPPTSWSGPGVPAGAPTSQERTWALAAHVGTFVAAWFAMGFLCPLIIMLTKGDSSAFVRRHAVESLNFQISVLIYGVVSFVLVFVLVGIPMLVALAVFALVVIIIATIKASAGEEYRYPLCLRLVS